MKHKITIPGVTFSLMLLFNGCLKSEQVNGMENRNGLAKEAAFVAEDSPGAFMGHPGHGMLAFDVLNLTDEQKEKLQTALPDRQEFREEMRSLKTSGAGFEEIQSAKKAHMESMYQNLKPILTEDQKQLAEEIYSSLESGIIPDVLVEQRLNRMQEHLGLSSEQLEQIKPILQKSMQDKLDIKKSADSRESHKAAMINSRQNFIASLNNILTEEQKQKMNSHGPKRGKGKGGYSNCKKCPWG